MRQYKLTPKIFALVLALFSINAYALSINLPRVPASGNCGANETQVMATNGVGCIPNDSGNATLGNKIDEVIVTAPRIGGTPQDQAVHVPTNNTTGGYCPTGWNCNSPNSPQNPAPPSTATPTQDTSSTLPTFQTVYQGWSQPGTKYRTVGEACNSAIGMYQTSLIVPGTITSIASVDTNNMRCLANVKKSDGTTGQATMNITSSFYGTAQCGTNEVSVAGGCQKLVCPTGYTSTGTTCTLTSPSTAQKPTDGHCNVIRSGNSFAGDPADPDCQTSGSPVVTQSPSKITTATPTAKGSVTQDSTTGTITVVIDVGDTGNNTTTTKTIVIDSGGNVTGTKEETSSGTGILNDPNTKAPVGGSGSASVDVSGLATHGDVAAVGSKVDAVNDTLKTASPADPTTQAKADYETASTNYGNKITGIQTQSMPFTWDWLPTLPEATCTPYVMNFAGKSITIDWCPTVEKLRDLFGFCLYIGTAFALFSILTGRRETA